MQGTSLVPLLKNEAVDWRESFLYEYFQEAYAPGFVTIAGVRSRKYKYIESPNLPQDINELYDLENDPGEMEKLKAETGYFDPDVYKY
jgi:N-acetylglucosamine-6-sulfatase